MRTLLWVVVGLNQAVLIIKSSITFSSFSISEFVFREQLEHHPGAQARLLRQAYKQLPLLRTWRWTTLVLGGTLAVVLFIYLVDSLVLGSLYALLTFACTALLAKTAPLQSIADALFIRLLEPILKLIILGQPILRLLGPNTNSRITMPVSKEEFTDQLRRLPSTVLDPKERRRLESVLAMSEKTTKDIMTPKKRMVTVEPSATLGPIVLSDLQKSGHRYFPVLKKKGQPEGILNLSDISDVAEAKKHQKVKDVMQSHFAVITEDTPLHKLAEAFLHEKEYVLFVINSKDEFSGIVTIADFMRQTLAIVTDERN